MRSWVRRFASDALEVLFPAQCVLCAEKIDPQNLYAPFCRACAADLRFSAYKLSLKEYDVFSLGSYKDQLRSCLHKLKFGHMKSIAPHLAKAYYELWKDKQLFERIDLIVPVPLSARRQFERGYNQSALLAEELSLITGIPWSQRALSKIRHTEAQMSLNREQRLGNLDGAFEASKQALEGVQRVLLLDDVHTTGSTALECLNTLKSQKKMKISVAAIAIA